MMMFLIFSGEECLVQDLILLLHLALAVEEALIQTLIICHHLVMMTCLCNRFSFFSLGVTVCPVLNIFLCEIQLSSN